MPDPETGEVGPEPEPAAEPAPPESAPAEPEPPEPEPVADAAPSTAEPSADAAPPAAEPTPTEPAAEVAPPPAEPPAAPAPTGTVGATAAPTTIVPVEGARPIKVGDVLNHIFEVKRFLARGGMGEVFEGCNVNTDERVAIKVMLPALAGRREGRRDVPQGSAHPHQAPARGARPLSRARAGAAARRRSTSSPNSSRASSSATCSARSSARPRSWPACCGGSPRASPPRTGSAPSTATCRPTTSCFPDGDVHQAKIIDFGIAKDLDASSATIVGDGFAGKLNYVAPEQLGDYRPRGRPVDRRLQPRAGHPRRRPGQECRHERARWSTRSTSAARGRTCRPCPASLRPLLEAMLRPDPKERMRSMDEVLAMLERRRRVPGAADRRPPPPPTPGVTRAGRGGGRPEQGAAARRRRRRRARRRGGRLVHVRRPGRTGRRWRRQQSRSSRTTSFRPAIRSRPRAARSTRCCRRSAAPGSTSPASRAAATASASRCAASPAMPPRPQQELDQALTGAGLDNARLDFGDVAPITPAGCAALDTYRQVRAPRPTIICRSPRPRFEMMMQPPGTPYAGEEACQRGDQFQLRQCRARFRDPRHRAVGRRSPPCSPDRADFEQALASRSAAGRSADEGNGRYRLNIDLDHQGWSGIILVSGRGPFDRDLVAPAGRRARARLAEASSSPRPPSAAWRVEMVWFESVNREAGDAAPPRAEPTAPQQSDDKPTE